ncbi:DNA repair protein RecO [Pedobacter sp.]|uniref:DNA repair protein RecO n=1 Tax=Pedobacter sp. TaxID=1411316 RepID=UPI00396D05ED
MLHKTRGVVLKITQYSETSVIAQVFTEKFGMQSYLINGVRKPKAKIPMSVLQSLHTLDLVVYHKPNMQLQRISEAKLSPVFRTIPYDLQKNTIIQFLNEVLYKCIRQHHIDEKLFDFIYTSLCWFDETEDVNVNFHLNFLMKLSKFLGFGPQAAQRTDQKYFDLQEGVFTSLAPVHPYFIDADEAQYLILLSNVSFENSADVKLNNALRRLLLDKVLIYFSLHTPSFGQISSHQILEEVLS